MYMVASQNDGSSNDIVFDMRFDDYWKLDNYFRRTGDFKGRLSNWQAQEARFLQASLRLWFGDVSQFQWLNDKGDSLAERLPTNNLALVDTSIASFTVQRGAGAWLLFIHMMSNEKFQFQ